MSYAQRTLSITVGGAPSWWSSKPDRQWFLVARGTGSGFDGGATIYQVRPSPEPFGISPNPAIWAYSGGTVDQTRGELLVTGGGHGDYAGNEVYALSLRSETPAWSRLCNPSPGAFTGASPAKNVSGQMSTDIGYNGWPAASHTYFNLHFVHDRLYLVKHAAAYSLANSAARVFWFDRKTLRWVAGPFFMTLAQSAYFNPGFSEEGPAVYLPAEDAFYVGVTNGPNGDNSIPTVYKLDGTTGALLATWNYPAVSGGLGNGCSAAIADHQFAAWSEYTYPNVRVYDTSGGGLSLTLKAVTDTTGDTQWWVQNRGGVYHAPSRAIISNFAGGENLAVLRVPANPLTGTWTAELVRPSNYADSSRIVPPTQNRNYGRWNIVNDMGDGRSAIVYMPETMSGPAYVMPLPASGV